MKERFAVEAVETAKAKGVDFVIVEESRSGEWSMFVPCRCDETRASVGMYIFVCV